MKKQLFSLIMLFHIAVTFAQVGIGTTTPDASSALDVKSTSAGFLPPRLTTAQRDAIALPAVGLCIYNITTNCLEWWNGFVWFNSCGVAVIPGNSLCPGKTISKTSCQYVTGAVMNDDPLTTLGIEYDWPDATSNVLGVGLGATTGTRALVEICGQCWTRYNMDIANTTVSAFTNSGTSTWSGYYNSAASEPAANEGRLYQWYAAMQGVTTERARGVCPVGFHIPSDCEWMFLEYNLGMSMADQQLTFFRNSGVVGQDLSAFSSSGTNITGFTGLFAGYRGNTGMFPFLNRPGSGYWWSSSETSATAVTHRGMDTDNAGISRNPNVVKAQAYCVRCLKD